MCFGGAVGLVRCLGQRCRAAHDLLPVVVRLRGEIMLTLFVDNQSVDFPDNRRGWTKDMLHEGLHIDMGLEWRDRVIGGRWRCGHARRDDRDNNAGTATDVDHLSEPAW